MFPPIQAPVTAGDRPITPASHGSRKIGGHREHDHEGGGEGELLLLGLHGAGGRDGRRDPADRQGGCESARTLSSIPSSPANHQVNRKTIVIRATACSTAGPAARTTTAKLMVAPSRTSPILMKSSVRKAAVILARTPVSESTALPRKPSAICVDRELHGLRDAAHPGALGHRRDEVGQHFHHGRQGEHDEQTEHGPQRGGAARCLGVSLARGGLLGDAAIDERGPRGVDGFVPHLGIDGAHGISSGEIRPSRQTAKISRPRIVAIQSSLRENRLWSSGYSGQLIGAGHRCLLRLGTGSAPWRSCREVQSSARHPR